MEDNKSNNRLLVVLIVILLLWNCILTIALSKQDDKNALAKENITNVNVTGFSTDLTGVISKISSSTVTISSGSNTSSGFIYKNDGDKLYIVTTYHSIVDDRATVILDNSIKIDALLKGYDLYCDVAVLEAESNFQITPVSLGDSELVKNGEFVVFMGAASSYEYANSPELAMVASNNRVINNSITHDGLIYNYFSTCLQLSNDLAKGYSGSGVFNMSGELVGIVTMKTASGNETLAITANEVKRIADEIIENGYVDKRILGIKGSYVKDMPNYLKSNLGIMLEQLNGVYVDSVLTSSFAGSFGLRSGDLILSINDKEITSFSDYLDVIYNKTNTYTFNIIRAGSEMVITGTVND